MNGALSKAQTPVLNAQSRLVPGPVWNWEAANGFEAGAHFSIEGHQCCTVEPSGGGAHVVHKLGEGRAVPQQLQTDLWVVKLAQRVQNLPSFLHLVGKSGLGAVLTVSNRGPKEGASCSFHSKPGREQGKGNGRPVSGNSNQFTFGWFQHQARSRSCSLEGSQRGSDHIGPSSDHNVIQIGKTKLDRALGCLPEGRLQSG
jgi:hypothetical protein